ncbi:Arginase/deacetylase, partial [Westerdykella ornata]
EERPPLRACDVAEEYFKKELEMHDGDVSAGTIVLLADQCFGHRFSRPKTSKATLSMIVERPERILASVLGISTAYVRLGERHCDGSNPPHPSHEPSRRIPFKIRKTSRAVDITSPVVTNVHGTKWMEELKSMCTDAPRKLATTGRELTREPNPPGLPNKQEFHDGDLYLCSESLNAFQGALGGVLDAVDAVFQGTDNGRGPSRAFVCIRPPGHHCSDDHPSGFCWINNVHVGIEHAMLQYGLTHAAIIDFDLHHGDGSQSIAWERNEKFQNAPRYTYAPYKRRTPMRSIGYFSLHDPRSFPCENGEKDKRQAASLCLEDLDNQTIWNIHMRSWTSVEEFWKMYEDRYLVLLDRTREYLKTHTQRLKSMPDHPRPKAAIFLSAGFDASEWEMQGMQRHGVKVPTEFYARFTRDVVRLAEEEGTAVEGRVISVLEGGYSDRALTSGVLSHLSGLTDGQLSSEPSAQSDLAFDMRKLALSLEEEAAPGAEEAAKAQARSYDPSWWHPAQLAELENLVNPPPAAKPKKLKSGPPPMYSSPTQSFTAKLTDPVKYHRSISGNFAPSTSVRVPTPPPPDVDWTTASHALSKLLIPFDRQTRSCKPEELSEPKVKKEKPAAVLASVHVDPSGRQLRGRKPATSYADPASDDETKSRTAAKEKANRRRTMAALPSASEEPAPARSASRRMSIASSTASVNGERSVSRASNVGGRRASVKPDEVGSHITVKKARAPATGPSRLPKNPPPVPRVPSNYTTKPDEKEKNENDVDKLSTGLKRITLRMPTREEHDAREKQKALEGAKKTSTTSTAARAPARKAPAARTKPTKPAPSTTRKGTGRTTKASKPQTPVDESAPSLPTPDPALPVSVPPPHAPKVEAALDTTLEQPQPVLPKQAVGVIDKTEEVESRSPPNVVEPPTELREMIISPEQLPKPSFMAPIKPASPTITPPRPDTPPAPAPSMMPTFVNYTAQTYGSIPAPAPPTLGLANQGMQSLQWMPPSTDGNTMSPVPQRQDLPTSSSTGTIPFASSNAASPGSDDAQGVEAKKEADSDIWEVPDTPAK